MPKSKRMPAWLTLGPQTQGALILEFEILGFEIPEFETLGFEIPESETLGFEIPEFEIPGFEIPDLRTQMRAHFPVATILSASLRSRFVRIVSAFPVVFLPRRTPSPVRSPGTVIR